MAYMKDFMVYMEHFFSYNQWKIALIIGYTYLTYLSEKQILVFNINIY